ncbi:MAG: metallophosphoesterase [Deltaproteobacteria bacterium]|nr:metallophosphoesterase [Candidatus Zymogenaceae bacterium]
MKMSGLCFRLLVSLLPVILFLLSPPAAHSQEAPVIVYGDSRHSHDVHRTIVSAITAENPSAVFHTGDYVTDPGREDQWNTFFEIIAPLNNTTSFYPARGNHDGGGTSFASRFSLPGGVTWYAADVSDMRFLVLDSNASLSPTSPQYRWLTDELSSADARYLCVVLHHPIYNSTAGGHVEDEKKLIPSIEGILIDSGVDLVFSGHVHAYERLEKSGVIYVISGGGGAGLYRQVERSNCSAVYEMKHHYVRIFHKDDGLVVEAVALDGSVIDSFTVDGD